MKRKKISDCNMASDYCSALMALGCKLRWTFSAGLEVKLKSPLAGDQARKESLINPIRRQEDWKHCTGITRPNVNEYPLI